MEKAKPKPKNYFKFLQNFKMVTILFVVLTNKIQAQNCVNDPCNMICNQSFEEGISLLGTPSFDSLGCGNKFMLGENCMITGNPFVNGWHRSKGTPNLFVRGSQKADTLNGVLVQPYNGIPNNVYSNGLPVETLTDNELNDRYIGVSLEADNQQIIKMDGIVNQLTKPVYHSREYTFSFWYLPVYKDPNTSFKTDSVEFKVILSNNKADPTKYDEKENSLGFLVATFKIPMNNQNDRTWRQAVVSIKGLPQPYSFLYLEPSVITYNEKFAGYVYMDKFNLKQNIKISQSDFNFEKNKKITLSVPPCYTNYKWYRDGQLFKQGNQKDTIQVHKIGEYYVTAFDLATGLTVSTNINPVIIALAEPCGTEDMDSVLFFNQPWINNNQYLIDLLDSLGLNSQAAAKSGDADLGRYWLPIKFWVYRNSDGSGAWPTEEDIAEAVRDMNNDHRINGSPIRFYIACNIHYMNDDNPSYDHWEPEAINVFCVESFGNGSSSGVFNPASDKIKISWDFIGLFPNTNTFSKTLIHEIGHYLGLEHPHRYWDRGKIQQEPVNHDRETIWGDKMCESHGDGLCDTPADPKVNRFKIDCTLGILDNPKDKWGDFYNNPPNGSQRTNLSLFMSYAGRCRTSFTHSQIGVMVDKVLKRELYNYDNLNFQSDMYEPDNNFNQANEMLVNTSQYHTFHYAPLDCKDDYIKFRLNSIAPNLTITTSAIPGENAPNTILTLYDENFNLMTTNDDFNGTGLSRIIVQNVPASQPNRFYYVRVESKGNAGNLHYNLSLYTCFDEQSVQINGPSEMCQTAVSNYTLSHNNTGVNSYTIEAPTGWKINGQSNIQTIIQPQFSLIAPTSSNVQNANIRVSLNGSTCNSGKIIKKVTVYPILTLPPTIQFKRIQCLFFPYVNPQAGAQTYEWSLSPSFTTFFSSTQPTTQDLAFEENELVNLYLRTRNLCSVSPVRSVHKTMGNVPGNCMQKVEKEFEEVKAEISIYPNPAENDLQIKLLNLESTSYVIYDFLGNVVLKNNLNNGDNTVNISGLAKGLYAIRFNNYQTLTFIKI